MNVYRYVADSDHYECIAVSKQERAIIDRFFDCRPLADVWQPVPVEVDASVGKPGDFPSLYGNVPVFSDRAWHVLRPLIGNSVEAVPIIHPAGGHLAINVLDVADCLDRSRSELAWYSDGEIMGVGSYSFKPGCLTDKHFFKIPQTSGEEVLVSDEFKSLVEVNGLQGLIFRRLWTSEDQ